MTGAAHLVASVPKPQTRSRRQRQYHLVSATPGSEVSPYPPPLVCRGVRPCPERLSLAAGSAVTSTSLVAPTAQSMKRNGSASTDRRAASLTTATPNADVVLPSSLHGSASTAGSAQAGNATRTPPTTSLPRTSWPLPTVVVRDRSACSAGAVTGNKAHAPASGATGEASPHPHAAATATLCQSGVVRVPEPFGPCRTFSDRGLARAS